MAPGMADEQDEDMNSHQDSPSAGEPANRAQPETGNEATTPGSSRVPGSGGFFGWTRSLGIVRAQDRWIGGVATGIAGRTGLDPILVRGLFVVLAIFGGIGLLAYGLAWALLPEPDGRIHAESAGRGNWTSGMTGALIVSILGLWRPNVPFLGDGGGLEGFLWSLFWVAVAVFIVYWIFNSSGRKAGAAAGSGPGDPAQAPQTLHGSSMADRGARQPASAAMPPPKPATPRPSGADIAVFLGGAVLLAGLVLALDYLGLLPLGSGAITVALATAVVVLGLGVVLLGIRGRTSGALGFLAAAGIVASLLSGASLGTGNWVVAAESHWTSTSVEPAQEGYTLIAAHGRIDLTELDGITEDAVIPVNAAASNVGILVPDDVPVEVRSVVALSSTQLATPVDSTSVDGAWRPGTLHLNQDATGPRIILDIRGVASKVTVATSEEALEDNESWQEP